MKKDIDPKQTIGFALHHASYLLKTTLKAEFRSAGYAISTEEFVMLNLIPPEGIGQTELREKSLKDKTNVTRLLSRMVEKGLTKRSVQENNRRQQFITLTSKGKTTQRALAKVAQKALGKVGAGIDPKDMEITRRTLDAISRNLV